MVPLPGRITPLILKTSVEGGAAINIYARGNGIFIRQANRTIRFTDAEARELALVIADHLTGVTPLSAPGEPGPHLTRYANGTAERVNLPNRRRVHTSESRR